MKTINMSNYHPQSALNTATAGLMDCLNYDSLPIEVYKRLFPRGDFTRQPRAGVNKSQQYAPSSNPKVPGRASADSLGGI